MTRTDRRPFKTLTLTIAAILVAIILAVRFYLNLPELSNTPAPAPSPNGPSLISLLLTETPLRFMQSFAHSVTNAATVEKWASWAEWALTHYEGNTNPPSLVGGVALSERDFPAFLPKKEALVTAGVINAGQPDGYVNFCWGGHDMFYGILVGKYSVPLTNETNEILLVIDPKLRVYLMKAYP